MWINGKAPNEKNSMTACVIVILPIEDNLPKYKIEVFLPFINFFVKDYSLKIFRRYKILLFSLVLSSFDEFHVTG